MSKALDELNAMADEYAKTPESWAHDLQLDLSLVILQGLKQKKWSLRALAFKSGISEQMISRLMHAEQNCTLATAGRVLHALDVRCEIQPMAQSGET